MSVQRLESIKVSETQFKGLIEQILARVLAHSTPVAVYVIGSMVTRVVTPESDVDIVLVYSDEPEVRLAQKAMAPLAPLEIPYPVEYIYTTNDRFEKMKDIGGVCFEAHNHGVKVYG